MECGKELSQRDEPASTGCTMTGKQRATEGKESAASSQKNVSQLTKPPGLATASLHPVLQLQQNIGNQAIVRLLNSGIVQAKLRIGHGRLIQTKPVPSARAFVDSCFDHDFSKAPSHTDARAAESAVAGHALGHDIFAGGQYTPKTESGGGLRGHELSQKVQPKSFRPSLLHAHFLQRKPVFKNCKEKEETLSAAIDEAKILASMALSALKGERLESIEKEHVQTALKNHFGDVTDKQKTTITERYASIHDTLDSKKITCVDREKKEKKKAICAEAPIHSQKISIFLHFWRDACGSKGEMMLHEAAHNAGAKDDIHLDEGYPPKAHAEDNAYSYQFFAVDVRKGPPRVRLEDPKVPKK